MLPPHPEEEEEDDDDGDGDDDDDMMCVTDGSPIFFNVFRPCPPPPLLLCFSFLFQLYLARALPLGPLESSVLSVLSDDGNYYYSD